MASTSATVTPPYAALFPTVDGLFVIVEQAKSSGAAPLIVSYDATLGYPTRIQIGDPAVDGPVLTVTEFLLGVKLHFQVRLRFKGK